MNLPPIIALCGWPKTGKSTVQKILADLYDVVPLDDGLPLREIAVQYLGLTHDQVTTQEGKAETIMINGAPWIARDVLGQLGNAMEEKYGGDVIPLMAVNRFGLDNPAGPNRHQSVSFASVRRQQGWFWRKRGALVIEIRRPGTTMGAEFNRYDAEAAHCAVINDGSLDDLSERVQYAMSLSDILMDESVGDGKLFELMKERVDAAQERIEPKGDQPEHQD